MNYEMLLRKNKIYDKINEVMKRLCFMHFDIFPIIANYKLNNELDFGKILDLIAEEQPIKILADDRLLSYFSKIEGFRLLDIDYAACKGEWARYKNLRFFFYHGAINSSLAKILLYNERAILNSQIVFKISQ